MTALHLDPLRINAKDIESPIRSNLCKKKSRLPWKVKTAKR